MEHVQPQKHSRNSCDYIERDYFLSLQPINQGGDENLPPYIYDCKNFLVKKNQKKTSL